MKKTNNRMHIISSRYKGGNTLEKKWALLRKKTKAKSGGKGSSPEGRGTKVAFAETMF